MAEDPCETALTRIAGALGVPVDAFYAANASTPGQNAVGAQAEAMEMQRAFAAVTDPMKRRECIAFVRRAASEGHSD